MIELKKCKYCEEKTAGINIKYTKNGCWYGICGALLFVLDKQLIKSLEDWDFRFYFATISAA